MTGHSAPHRTHPPLRTARLAQALLMLIPLVLAACGGGSGSDAPATGIAAPSGFAVGYGTKGYTVTWTASAGASRYELLEDPDGPAGPQPEVIAAGVNDGSISTVTHHVASALLYERVNATYRLRACDISSCGAPTAAITPDVTQAIGYFKAGNSGQGDAFGNAVALSSDGLTMAVGAPGERSNATCIAHGTTDSTCNQNDNSVVNAGAVYVLSRDNRFKTWVQTAYLKASNNRAFNVPTYIDSGPRFGTSLGLSADGTLLVVGAPGETSSARGVNGDATNTQTQGAGAVYVFKRVQSALNRVWRQEAYIKASNTRPQAEYNVDIIGYYVNYPQNFGATVAVSADGSILAVSAPGERSKAAGVNGDQSDHSMPQAGAVYTYTRTSSGDSTPAIWAHQAYLKASHPAAGAQFGASLAMAADGRTLAVGASGERSASTGLNGAPNNTSLPSVGAAYVFSRSGDGPWSQQAYVKASNPGNGDQFGHAVALSADGNTLAVGAIGESSEATGVNNAPGARTLGRAGAAYLFTRSNAAWNQQAHIKPSNTQANAWFGWRLALSADGSTLAVGAMAEAGNGRGLNANQADRSAGGAGAAYMFERSDSTWAQKAYLKAPNTDVGDLFGAAMALSGDGKTLAVGATAENSLATGLQGNQADNSALPGIPSYGIPTGVGAVYLY